MKYIYFLLMSLISCNEVSYRTFVGPKLKEVRPLEVERRIGMNKKKIEVMLMFLWPDKISLEEEKTVTEIIALSIDVFKDRNTYLESLKDARDTYLENACECHLYYECEGDQIEDEEMIPACESFEEKKTQLESENSYFYQKYRDIKFMVESIGGEYLNVGMDDDFVNIGEVDLANKEISLNSAGFYSGERKQQKMKVLRATEKELDISCQYYHLDLSSTLDIINKEYGLIFQGELHSSRGQRGVIYWEHMK